MKSVDFKGLEDSLYKSGDRQFEGVTNVAIGTQVSAEDYGKAFVRVAMDLWCLEPNLVIDEAFWKLSDDKKFFVKVYDSGEPTPHDHKWSVFADDTNEKVSIAYKNDPLVTLDMKTLGFGDGNIIAAQKSLLKLLSTKDGMTSLLGSVDENTRNSFLGRYPELGV